MIVKNKINLKILKSKILISLINLVILQIKLVVLLQVFQIML